MEPIKDAGPWAAVIAVMFMAFKQVPWARLFKSRQFRKAVEAAVADPKDLADTVAEAFAQQYGNLVDEVKNLRSQVEGLTEELHSARGEIEQLRSALALAHTEIERLTAALSQK